MIQSDRILVTEAKIRTMIQSDTIQTSAVDKEKKKDEGEVVMNRITKAARKESTEA